MRGRGGRGAALVAFVRLGRPQFLVGGFLLYALGAAVAVRGLRVAWNVSAYLLGQAAVTSIQLMTHYGNDYFDLAADQANLTPTQWSGGSRVLPSGIVEPRVALMAAWILGTTGLLLVGVLAARGAMVAAVVLALAEILAWFYSAPPLRLHSRGLGELTTAAVVTGLTPMAGFLLQRGTDWRPGAGWLTLAAVLWPLLGLQFCMLLAVEFPDAAGDAAVGKRTLVVRLGHARAAALYRAALIAVYGALPLFARAGVPLWIVVSAAVPGPLAWIQFRRLGKGAWKQPHRHAALAFMGVALLIGTAACELLAIVVVDSATAWP